MENLTAVAGQYGAIGLMLLACFYYINKKDKDHKEEREEINARFEEQHKEALEITRSNTSAMIELVTVIKSR